MAGTRISAIVERLNSRLDAVIKAVPPIRPPSAYWLNSDGGPSYCYDCVKIARGKEFELGTLIVDEPYFARDEWADAFHEGFDGGFDTTSDSSQACAICRCTLSYILSDYGVEEELSYWRESPLMTLRDEDTYALDRLTLNIGEWSPRAQILGAAMAVNQAYRLLPLTQQGEG